MNYQEFVGSVTDFLRESLPSGTKLEMLPLEKNNGVILDGLSIRRQGQKVAPTIYMDAYYREYLDGRSLKGICDQIIECCSNTDFEEKFNADFFSDYSRLQHTVVYKLINAEKNRELLKKIPHLPFLDLAIVFYCLLEDTPVGNATVLIHNSHLKLWKAGCSDLYRDAKANAVKLLPARLSSMADVIRELSGGLEEPEEVGVPMYVLTNSQKSLGAACILYEGVLESCADRIGGEFYMLPSSIHEVIMVPASAVSDEQELTAMVRDINRTQVRDTEILSDNIYLYSPVSGKLTLIAC
ncbi:hypothetical protein B5E77_06905 [Lachnoclostridium sp. An131]|uniref:DUF5688 family protein n=1 Tax=Lachnoclostridium sp. An131 TaxID=1965555 RepID=UPI000B37370E|nr:DUF5688 family protein [Lachnoclostridium sp. An131]OUQ27276.1 hypothetical protein B5E77_06905 [Lachnoclostridium sp. An131]